MWYNIYTNPRAPKEFEGNPHPTKEEADKAAAQELADESQTRLVRQEERPA